MNIQTALKTPKTFETPKELEKFWYDVCNSELKFAIEICDQYDEHVKIQINLLQSLICNKPYVESNKNDLQLATETLHKFSGSLALLGFPRHSQRIHLLELQFINQTASLNQARFDYIQTQVWEVSTLIRQHILRAA
ncbi:MAG: Hpt domain-containing protein [Shewanella sp.]